MRIFNLNEPNTNFWVEYLEAISSTTFMGDEECLNDFMQNKMQSTDRSNGRDIGIGANQQV